MSRTAALVGRWHHPTRLLLQSPLFLEHVSNRPPATWMAMAQAFAAPWTGLLLLSFQLELTSLNIVGCHIGRMDANGRDLLVAIPTLTPSVLGHVLVAIPFVQPLPLPALNHQLMMDLVIDNIHQLEQEAERRLWAAATSSSWTGERPPALYYQPRTHGPGTRGGG
ncbi:hypothetical protein ACA910_006460 [Epithemia clementina (nom. ined.)]